jgi:hypothetical protein
MLAPALADEYTLRIDRDCGSCGDRRFGKDVACGRASPDL